MISMSVEEVGKPVVHHFSKSFPAETTEIWPFKPNWVEFGHGSGRNEPTVIERHAWEIDRDDDGGDRDDDGGGGKGWGGGEGGGGEGDGGGGDERYNKAGYTANRQSVVAAGGQGQYLHAKIKTFIY